MLRYDQLEITKENSTERSLEVNVEVNTKANSEMNPEVNSGGTPEVNSEITTEAAPEVNPDTSESVQFQEIIHRTIRNRNKLKWNITNDDLPTNCPPYEIFAPPVAPPYEISKTYIFYMLNNK